MVADESPQLYCNEAVNGVENDAHVRWSMALSSCSTQMVHSCRLEFIGVAGGSLELEVDRILSLPSWRGKVGFDMAPHSGFHLKRQTTHIIR